MNVLFQSYLGPDNEITLIIEDNGRVAYAYLRLNTKIIGDVWLYNRAETPDVPEWENKAKLPFLNPVEYCAQAHGFSPLESVERLTVEWLPDRNGHRAKIFIDGILHATLAAGEKPGFCRFAKKNGPLANLLQLDE